MLPSPCINLENEKQFNCIPLICVKVYYRVNIAGTNLQFTIFWHFLLSWCTKDFRIINKGNMLEKLASMDNIRREEEKEDSEMVNGIKREREKI